MHAALAGSLSVFSADHYGLEISSALELLQQIEKEGATTSASLRDFVLSKLKTEGELPGFSHPLLETEDVRATILYDFAKSRYLDDSLVQIAFLLREEIAKEDFQSYLKKEGFHHIYPNSHAISGALFKAAGFDAPTYYPLLVAFARLVGVSSQITYERVVAKGGRGTPLLYPRYLYKAKGSC